MRGWSKWQVWLTLIALFKCEVFQRGITSHRVLGTFFCSVLFLWWLCRPISHRNRERRGERVHMYVYIHQGSIWTSSTLLFFSCLPYSYLPSLFYSLSFSSSILFTPFLHTHLFSTHILPPLHLSLVLYSFIFALPVYTYAHCLYFIQFERFTHSP